MAPPATHVMKVPHFTKGGEHAGKIRFPDQEEIPHETTTVKDTITTVINTISSTIQETLINTNTNTNSSAPSDEGGFSEMTNSTNTNNANMNATFNQEIPDVITTSTGTSFEEITTTLMDGMHMEHIDDSEGYNTVLFIVLGIVLGLLIIAAIVLGVVYSHYKKRGFQEISGEQGTVDPQSMKQLQQASSQDALLDK